MSRKRKPEKPKPGRKPRQRRRLVLTDLERLAYLGLKARYQSIALATQAANAEVKVDEERFVESVTGRLRLAPGSIGTKYQIDSRTWEVQLIPRPAPEAKS